MLIECAVNSSPAMGVECEVDQQVKEPLIGDLIDLVGFTEKQSGSQRPGRTSAVSAGVPRPRSRPSSVVRSTVRPTSGSLSTGSLSRTSSSARKRADVMRCFLLEAFCILVKGLMLLTGE